MINILDNKIPGIDKPHHVYAEMLEAGAIEQFKSAMEQPFVVQGALMPDAHQGYSLPIGGVIATKDVIVPAWVGYDIGCGMCAYKTPFKAEQLTENIRKAIFDRVYQVIPVGGNHHTQDQDFEIDLPKTAILDTILKGEYVREDGVKINKGSRQVGTLGGGNHFLEFAEDGSKDIWIVLHSGSRGIGHTVAGYYMKLASNDDTAKEGHFGFDVNSQEGRDYITDMNHSLAFALENRKQMITAVYKLLEKIIPDAVEEPMDFDEREGTFINRNHNHAELSGEYWIHRKGATHADAGMYGVIPGNMRDGSFVVKGKGNFNSLFSSSHGAGRVLGRYKARKQLSIDEFKETMIGITAKVTEKTLDESPFAYKNISDVMDQQKELVEVIHHLKPLVNIKA